MDTFGRIFPARHLPTSPRQISHPLTTQVAVPFHHSTIPSFLFTSSWIYLESGPPLWPAGRHWHLHDRYGFCFWEFHSCFLFLTLHSLMESVRQCYSLTMFLFSTCLSLPPPPTSRHPLDPIDQLNSHIQKRMG
jgi:hypothetical protein